MLLNLSFILGMLSVIVGTVGALYQEKLQRLIAFSGIVNMGFIMIGFGCGTVTGFAAALYYLVTYIVSFTLFVASIVTVQGLHTEIKTITRLVTVASSHGPIAIIMTIALFSLAGIPPLAGFYAKL